MDRIVVPLASALTHRRNLVVLRAGDGSLHRGWVAALAREFDLYLSAYGARHESQVGTAEYHEFRPGPKWPAIAQLLAERPELLERYDTFWFPDDDLESDTDTLDRMFAFFRAYRLDLAQPALTRGSYYTWDTLLQAPDCHLRYGRFVEPMAPIFSRAALRACAPSFVESASGWGLDWAWPVLCARAGLHRIAVIDATPVRHTRPVGGELYRNHPGLDPRADAAAVIRKYGLQEVRAVAKYSFTGAVQDVRLPARTRLIYWLKRLNGRRKHLGRR